MVSNTINHHLMRICERADVEYMSSHKIRFWSVTNMHASGMQQADIQLQQTTIREYHDLVILILIVGMKYLDNDKISKKIRAISPKTTTVPQLYPALIRARRD